MYQIFHTVAMKSGRLVAPSGRIVVVMDGEVALNNPNEIAWMKKEIEAGAFPFSHVGEREEFKQDPLAVIKAQLRAEVEHDLLQRLGDMGVELPEALRPTSTSNISAITEGSSVGAATVTLADLSAKLEALKG